MARPTLSESVGHRIALNPSNHSRHGGIQRPVASSINQRPQTSAAGLPTSQPNLFEAMSSSIIATIISSLDHEKLSLRRSLRRLWFMKAPSLCKRTKRA